MAPHWPQDGLYGVPTVIWHHNSNFHFLGKIDDLGYRKIRIFGHGNFLRFWPIFLLNGTPLAPRGTLGGSPQ